MKVKYNTNHTFALCAYKDSPYLESCIKSILKQSVQSNVFLCTSTPSEFISSLANQYGLELFIREGDSDIQEDWNFGCRMAQTDLVTVAHQDDVYQKDYVKILLEKYEKYPDMTLFISDYMPIKNGKAGKRDLNSFIKRILRFPLKFSGTSHLRWVKRSVLALGNTICCPTCAYNKKILGDTIFQSDLKFSLDWDTFLRLAEREGRFLYADQPLVFYRIHDDATSKAFINDKRRVTEDETMFSKFWPRPIVKFIMVFYKKAYDTNG